MDVWIEFRNASKWQAEALFRNFFPSTDEDNIILEGDLEGVELPGPPPPPQSPTTSHSSTSSTLWSMSPSFSSSTSDLSSPPTPSSPRVAVPGPEAFGAKNQAYMPPAVEEHIAACQHSAKPLDGAKLAGLAKAFADSIPDEEFSVAALQGCELSDFFRLVVDHHLLFVAVFTNLPFDLWFVEVELVCVLGEKYIADAFF
jgi:chaperone BCS1